MEQRVPTNSFEKNLLQNLATINSLLGEGSAKAIEKIFSIIKTPNQIGVFTVGKDDKRFEVIGNFFAFAVNNFYTNANTLRNLLNNPKFKCDVTFTIKEKGQKHIYHPVTYLLGHNRSDLVEAFFEASNLDWTNITISLEYKSASTHLRLDAPIIYGFIKQDIDLFKKAIKKYSDISFFTNYKSLNLLIEIISIYKNDEDLCIQYLESVLDNFKEPAKLINIDYAPINGVGNRMPTLLFATELGLTKVIDLLAPKPSVRLDMSWKHENMAAAAVFSGKLNVLQHLHDKKYINPKKVGRALHIACRKENLAMVDFMVKHNYHQHAPNQAGMDLRNMLNEKCEPDIELGLEIPLQIAVGIGNLEIASLLINEGKISIDTTDGYNKRSAIFTAIQTNPSVLDWVLEQKPDVNLADKNGDTPLLFAIKCQNLDVIKKLVAAGANIETANDYNITPLILAVLISSRTEIVEFLCSISDINIYAEDWNGYTAFHYAFFFDKVDILKILLNNLDTSEKRNVIAYELAQISNKFPQNSKCIQLLTSELDGFKKVFSTLASLNKSFSDMTDAFKELADRYQQIKQLTELKVKLTNKSEDKPHNNPTTSSSTFFSHKSLKTNKPAKISQEISYELQSLATLLKELSWFKGTLNINDKRHLVKHFRKSINCYLYLSEELIIEQARKQNYAHMERLEALIKEPYPKFHHALNDNNNYQIQVQIGDCEFTTQLTQEIYIEGKARILVFPIPEEYKDNKTQRGTLYMGIFSKDGLHEQGDTNRLLAANKTIKIPLPPSITEANEEQKLSISFSKH